jgi:Zn finger protein HypA/HybF involved in hydrogenase expression
MYKELNEGSKHFFIVCHKNVFKCDQCNNHFNQNDKVFYCDKNDSLLCEECKRLIP